MPVQRLPRLVPSFGGMRPRGGLGDGAGGVSSSSRPSIAGKGIFDRNRGVRFGHGAGIGAGGKGMGRAGLKRHRYVLFMDWRWEGSGN